MIALDNVRDPVNSFKNVVQCPVCGCLEHAGTLRCPECGTFHSGRILEERKAPTPEEVERYSNQMIDPVNYSIRPNQSMPDESFEESDDVIHWEGGNTDFSFEDDTPPLPLKKTAEVLIPDDEVITEN